VAHLGGEFPGAAQRGARSLTGLAAPLDLPEDQQAAGQFGTQR
jgi:hypothetical protein